MQMKMALKFPACKQGGGGIKENILIYVAV